MRGTFGAAVEFEEQGVRPALRDDPGVEGGTEQHLRRNSA